MVCNSAVMIAVWGLGQARDDGGENLVPEAGLEPTTSCLQGKRSTN